MNRIKEKKAYWIGGSLVAFAGVALVRLLAPLLEGLTGRMSTAAGYFLVIAGLMIIGFATRRKESEAFISVDHNSLGDQSFRGEK